MMMMMIMMMMMMMMTTMPEGRSLLVESLGQFLDGVNKKAVSDSESGPQHPERFIQETAFEYL